jgi:hypothetical protein
MILSLSSYPGTIPSIMDKKETIGIVKISKKLDIHVPLLERLEKPPLR